MTKVDSFHSEFEPGLNLLGLLPGVMAVSSPRIECLRAIAARIVELESTEGFDTNTSPEFAALSDEIGATAEAVWATEPQGLPTSSSVLLLRTNSWPTASASAANTFSAISARKTRWTVERSAT